MKRLNLQQTNRPMDVFLYWRKDRQLMLDAPYQRGDVWGPIRQRNLIKSLLQGIPIPSLIVNDRSRTSNEFAIAVIDGKQRITAILKFLDSQLDVPGEWFDLPGERYLFCELPRAQQRLFENIAVAVSEGCVPREEEAEIFELVNYGGVPQGQSDHPNP